MDETRQDQTQTTNEDPSRGSGTAEEVRGMVGQLEALLDEYLVKKAPFSLPNNVKEFIVKVAPYLIIVMAVLAAPIIFTALSLSVLLAPFAFLSGVSGGGFGFFGVVHVVTSLASIVVELFAVKGLLSRTKRGWTLVFYASIISLLGSVLALNIVNGILGAVIGWYFLFQVKDKYVH